MIEKGFDFLGYHFSRAELTVARATLENFAVRALRLYEQERGKQLGFPRFGEYVRRRAAIAWRGSSSLTPTKRTESDHARGRRTAVFVCPAGERRTPVSDPGHHLPNVLAVAHTRRAGTNRFHTGSPAPPPPWETNVDRPRPPCSSGSWRTDRRSVKLAAPSSCLMTPSIVFY